MDIVETGQGKSQSDRRKQVLAVIEEQNRATAEAVIDIIDIDEATVERNIDSLTQREKVYEIDGELRKWQSGAEATVPTESQKSCPQ